MICITISVIFISFGLFLMMFPPRRINSIYGYRTSMSMKNQDTWDKAQWLGGKSLLIFGIITGIFGQWGVKLINTKHDYLLQLCFVIVISFAMIGFDEMRLRKIFNEDGSRKNK